MFNSLISFTITAQRSELDRLVRILFKRVVFPLPKNPDKSVTATGVFEVNKGLFFARFGAETALEGVPSFARLLALTGFFEALFFIVFYFYLCEDVCLDPLHNEE